MPRETVLSGIAAPPPNAIALSIRASTFSTTSSTRIHYFRLRNTSTSFSIAVTNIIVSTFQVPLQVYIYAATGDLVDNLFNTRWLDPRRSGVPSANSGEGDATDVPLSIFADLALVIVRDTVNLPIPQVLRPGDNLVVASLTSSTGFNCSVLFFSPG